MTSHHESAQPAPSLQPSPAMPSPCKGGGTCTGNGARIVGTPHSSSGPGPDLMLAETLTGNDVVNIAGEAVGYIKGIMLDVRSGCIAYAVLAVAGFLGIREKLFAVPWSALALAAHNNRFILDVSKERLSQAPGFDKDNWPSMSDMQWASDVHRFYHVHPYWK